VNKSSKKS